MRGPNTTVIRRLLPVLAVATVLGLSYIAQPAVLGASNDVGYGYRNNCGIKGDGFHDHGKPCPNRPFPGHGKGLTKAVQSGETGTSDSDNESASVSTDTDVNDTNATVTTSTTTSNDQNTGKTHGKGHSHSNNGKGHRD
ncbi:MAG TPA: hypothetical protein VGR71_15200 [Nitrospira sp.]|nr:hypothetical protein [Nitrospira sp.]